MLKAVKMVSFKLETTDIDLGDTPIENIFINDYMPMADGTYVKVYLLGFKYAHDKDSNIEVNNETISKHLEIPLSDVLRAWDFWQGKGIIEKIPKSEGSKYDYEVKFLNLKQLYIKNNYKPVTTNDIKSSTGGYVCSEEDLIEANDIAAINKMFNSIDYVMRRQLVPNEKKKVLEWIYNYNMNPDMVIKAFFYAIEKKGIRKVNYVEGIIRNWYDDGITNVEALQQKFKKSDEKYYRYDRIMKYLGYGKRLPTESEMDVIDKWFDKYGYSLEVVLKACENSKKTSNPSINYIDGILTSWFSKGIKAVEEIEEKDKNNGKEEYKGKRNYQKATGKPVKTRFHNFEQRTSNYTSEELEEIAKKKREEYYFKSKGE